MSSEISLVIIGDGRKDYLQKTVNAARWYLNGRIIQRLMVNDSGESWYADHLNEKYGNDGWEIINHPQRRGLAAAIQSAWRAVDPTADYILHLEEDFTFNSTTDLEIPITYLKRNPELAQMVYKRNCVNPAEQQVGGYIQQRPELYTQRDGYVEQDYLFMLNPCIYPRSLTEVGWPDKAGEREFTDHLQKTQPGVKFGILGTLTSPHQVTHIGAYRSEGWKL